MRTSKYLFDLDDSALTDLAPLLCFAATEITVNKFAFPKTQLRVREGSRTMLLWLVAMHLAFPVLVGITPKVSN